MKYINCYYTVPGTHKVFQPLCRLYDSYLYSRNYFYILALLKSCGLFTGNYVMLLFQRYIYTLQALIMSQTHTLR